jgi:hypothetical protein
VNPALTAVALVTIAGAVLAVSARDVRTTILGILVVLLAAPLIANPLPGPVAILVRVAASLLAVRLLAIGLRGDATTGGSRIGWPAEALLAAAAAIVGFGSHGLGSAGLGPAEAQAAGFALVVLAVAPLFTGRDALRLAVGALLVLMAASLIRAGLDRAPSEAEHLVTAVLTIALGGAIAVIVTAARAAGGLGAIDAETGGAGRRLPDAHRDPARSSQATVATAGGRSTPPPGRPPAPPRALAPPDRPPAPPRAGRGPRPTPAASGPRREAAAAGALGEVPVTEPRRGTPAADPPQVADPAATAEPVRSADPLVPPGDPAKPGRPKPATQPRRTAERAARPPRPRPEGDA